jgi:WD40 repeat protein
VTSPSGHIEIKIDGDKVVECLALSPHGKRLATGMSDGTIIIWDTDSGKEASVLRGHEKDVRAVKYSGDGETLLSTGDDKTTRVWAVGSRKELRKFPAYNVRPHGFGAAISLDGKVVAVADYTASQKIRLWDVATGNEYRIPETSADVLAFLPDNKTLVTGSYRGVESYDITTWKKLGQVKGAPDEGIWSIAISRNGKIGVVGGAETAWAWDIPSGKVLGKVAHGAFVDSVAVTDDGRTAFSGGLKPQAKLWLTATGKILAQTKQGDLPGVIVGISPDGNKLVFAWLLSIEIWETSAFVQEKK